VIRACASNRCAIVRWKRYARLAAMKAFRGDEWMMEQVSQLRQKGIDSGMPMVRHSAGRKRRRSRSDVLAGHRLTDRRVDAR